MILSLLLITAPLEKPKPCSAFIQLVEIKRQAKLSKFQRWLKEQKEDSFEKLIRENQELIAKIDKQMGKK